MSGPSTGRVAVSAAFTAEVLDMILTLQEDIGGYVQDEALCRALTAQCRYARKLLEDGFAYDCRGVIHAISAGLVAAQGEG